MRRFLGNRRPSPAMAVAFVALLAALSGTAIALPGKNSVDSGDIKNGQVKGKDIARNAVTGVKVKNNALTGRDVRESTLGQVPSANSANSANTANSANSANSASTANRANSAGSVDTFQVYSRLVAATPGADFEAARTAAPEIALAQRGAFAIYGKCFQDDSGPIVHSVTYIRTGVDGSVLDSDETSYGGDPFLDVATAENDRDIHATNANANDGDFYASHTAEWQAVAPGGSAVIGSAGNGAKEGDVPGGNGVYGAGDACLFTGFLAG